MKTKEISSFSNPDFRKFSSLFRGRGIRKHGVTFLSGSKQVGEVLRDYPGRCAGLVMPGGHRIPRGTPDHTVLYRLSPELFREIDIYGTGQPLLLIRVDPLPLWEAEDRSSGCTLFLPFQDPANVGAAIRSAAAFGVSRVVVLKEAAHPYHHRSCRVAGSNLLKVPLMEGPSLGALGPTGFPVIALSPEGSDIASFRFPPTFGLLPGLEGPGLPTGIGALTTLGIPMARGVESLNAATAAGIALYLWRRGCSEQQGEG